VVTAMLIHVSMDTIWIWPAMFAHGIVLIFLFAPLHETIHRTAFHSRALNDITAFIIGVLLMLPREYFRAFHFAHHRFTQDPARDPELAAPKPTNLRQWLWHVSGVPYWMAQTRGTVEHAFGRATETFYKDDNQRRVVILEARI